jgi:hypothetical protein
MITRFLRKRNQDTAKLINKNFARIQVSGNNQTFKFKKTVSSAPVDVNYLNTEAGFRLTTESAENLILE